MNKKQLKIIKNYIEINGGATLDARLNFTALNRGYMVSLQGFELKATLKDEFYKVGAFRSYDKKRFNRQGVDIMKSGSIVESLISLDKSCDRSCGFGCSEIEITHKKDGSIEILLTYSPMISFYKTLKQKLVLIAY